MRRVALILVTVVVATRAHAQPAAEPGSQLDPKAVAEQLEAEAQALATSGDMLGAAAKFRAAHDLDPRPELLCNVGVAYHKAKDLPRAQLWLSQCLSRGTSLAAEFVTGVRSVLAAAEDKLREGEFTPVDIVVEPAGATVVIDVFGADDAFVGSRLVYVPFGTRTITVTSEGYRERTETVEATARDQRAVRITLERAPGPVLPPPGTSTPSKTPAIIVTIATGVVGLAAGAAYLQARNRAGDAGDAVEAMDFQAYTTAVDKARNWQKLSWIAAGAAGAGAIAAGYLWYRATRTPQLEVAPTDGGVAVTLSGSF